MRGEWGLLEVRYEGGRRWVGSDPAPAPSDSPTEARKQATCKQPPQQQFSSSQVRRSMQTDENQKCFARFGHLLLPINPPVDLVWSAARIPG